VRKVRSLFVSTLLLVAGAILVWALTGSVAGIDLNTVGGTLILAGLLIALVSLVLWASREGFTGRREGHTVLRR
jgi:ABC-type uncharacterized transport system permease subunit